MHRGVRRAAVAVLGSLLLAGCTSTGDPSPPAGVDELTIPTPSPDPDDFVAGIDNPWLALEPGSTTTLTGPTGEIALEVADQPADVEGVATTEVTLDGSSYLLAQDDDGNVWRFVDGAEPGLFMAATPRFGDGYRTAYDEGTFEERAYVAEVDGDTVEISTTDPARPGADTVATYERGTGLVRLETAGGVFER